MPSGGYGPGAGRPKGAKNKPKGQDNTKHEASTAYMTPLEYLLNVMRDESVPTHRRIRAAKVALPYIYPKAS